MMCLYENLQTQHYRKNFACMPAYGGMNIFAVAINPERPETAAAIFQSLKYSKTNPPSIVPNKYAEKNPLR
jgi:hypothetical protein